MLCQELRKLSSMLVKSDVSRKSNESDSQRCLQIKLKIR